MKYPGDCYFWVERAKSYSDIAKLIYSNYSDVEEDVFTEINIGAFNMAMAMEAALRYLLASADVPIPDTHDHLVLAEECEKNGIPVPGEVSLFFKEAKDYESQLRCDVNFVVGTRELGDMCEKVSPWCEKLYKDFIEEIYDSFQTYVLPGMLKECNGDKEALVYSNKELLVYSN